MAANLSSQPNLKLTDPTLAYAEETPDWRIDFKAVSQNLAGAMSTQELSYFQMLVQETMKKSKSAIRTGLLIMLSGMLMASSLPKLMHHTDSFSLPYLFSLREFWITFITFSLIGIYLMCQGLVGKKQSLTHIAILDDALKLKKETC